MRFRNLFRFIKHINKIGICSEKKRIAYSISHIVVMAISCVFAYFTYYLIANGNEIMSNHGFIVWLFSLFGIALSAFIAIKVLSHKSQLSSMLPFTFTKLKKEA